MSIVYTTVSLLVQIICAIWLIVYHSLTLFFLFSLKKIDVSGKKINVLQTPEYKKKCFFFLSIHFIAIFYSKFNIYIYIYRNYNFFQFSIKIIFSNWPTQLMILLKAWSIRRGCQKPRYDHRRKFYKILVLYQNFNKISYSFMNLILTLFSPSFFFHIFFFNFSFQFPKYFSSSNFQHS